MNRVVTIDLGSNSFRVLVYDCDKKSILNEYHTIVGTADGLIDSDLISNEAIQRIIDAINDSSEKLKYNPKECIAVTTAAMRIAKNKDYVLDRIYKETGLALNIIDAQEEARLTLLAVKYALKRENIPSQDFILLDIGGGSVELIINTNESFIIKSFNFGIVTLEQMHKSISELTIDLKEKKKKIEKYIKSLNVNLENHEFIATAGTPTTVASIKLGQTFKTYDKSKINGTKINLEDLDSCLNLLISSNEKKSLKIFGTNNKEFIEVGILIYATIFDALNKKESIVFDDGLREGVAINYAISKNY
mgnify:CR=1 FL=1